MITIPNRISEHVIAIEYEEDKDFANDILRIDHDCITFVNIGDGFAEIFRSSVCHRVLRKDVKLTQNRAQIEIAHRLRLAWASFHKHRKASTNRDVSLRLRLRLFHSVCISLRCLACRAFRLLMGCFANLTLCNAVCCVVSLDGFEFLMKIGTSL